MNFFNTKLLRGAHVAIKKMEDGMELLAPTTRRRKKGTLGLPKKKVEWQSRRTQMELWGRATKKLAKGWGLAPNHSKRHHSWLPSTQRLDWTPIPPARGGGGALL